MSAMLFIPAGCAAGKGGNTDESPKQPSVGVHQMARPTPPPTGGEVAALPSAMLYKTSGDYRFNVPVTFNDARTALVSFPAPGDITMSQAPVPMAGGYLLDRRGIGPNTAFTSYTYEQYAKLPSAPSPSELMRAVIPGARITEIVALPMTMSKAAADTAAVNKLIIDGLPGCTVVYR